MVKSSANFATFSRDAVQPDIKSRCREVLRDLKGAKCT